jgi:hypothetical protein
MKTKLIVCLCCFCQFSLFSQDLIGELKKLTLLNDSLQKQVLIPLKDSLIKSNNSHDIEIAKFKKQLKAYEKENEILNDNKNALLIKFQEFSSSRLANDRDNYKTKNDSLIKLLTSISTKFDSINKDIIKQKQNYDKLVIQEKLNSKQEFIDRIANDYKLPFSDLLKIVNLNSIERDLVLIGDNKEVNDVIFKLRNYFLAEQVLHSKYNDGNVNNALNLIDKIEKVELVELLKDKLDKYSDVNAGLLKAVNDIILLDSKTKAANNPNIQKEKLKLILGHFAFFYKNYQFNFSDYPYLTEIIVSINKLKQKDSDSDLNEFLDKL